LTPYFSTSNTNSYLIRDNRNKLSFYCQTWLQLDNRWPRVNHVAGDYGWVGYYYPTSYLGNGNLLIDVNDPSKSKISMGSVSRAASTLWLMDNAPDGITPTIGSAYGITATSPNPWTYAVHGNRNINVLFAEGHVESVNYKAMLAAAAAQAPFAIYWDPNNGLSLLGTPP
jgi:prepilin-type processing-associated H-X9-DG protein